MGRKADPSRTDSQTDLTEEAGGRSIPEAMPKPSLFDELASLPPLDPDDWRDEIEDLPRDPVEL